MNPFSNLSVIRKLVQLSAFVFFVYGGVVTGYYLEDKISRALPALSCAYDHQGADYCTLIPIQHQMHHRLGSAIAAGGNLLLGIMPTLITLGIFLVFTLMDNNPNDLQGAVLGMQGGMVQMISHGFISGALFLCVGVLYDRMHSRQIADYGGVVNTMPVFATFMVLFAMANSGLPGTSGFVGEFLVVLASFKADFWFAFLAATTLVLGAAYSLWLVKRVVFGDVGNEQVAKLEDVNGREILVLGSLAAVVLLFGIWPAPLVDVMEVTLQNLVAHVTISKL